MKKLLSFFLFVSSPAFAAPVYLECSIVSDGRPSGLTVSADEANSIVTIMVEGTPAPQRFAAAFNANQVKFGGASILYTLDRTSMALVREVRQYGWIDKGTCQLAKPVKRAF